MEPVTKVSDNLTVPQCAGLDHTGHCTKYDYLHCNVVVLNDSTLNIEFDCFCNLVSLSQWGATDSGGCSNCVGSTQVRTR